MGSDCHSIETVQLPTKVYGCHVSGVVVLYYKEYDAIHQTHPMHLGS